MRERNPMNWKPTILVLLPLVFSSSHAQQVSDGRLVPPSANHQMDTRTTLEAITLRQMQSLSPEQARDAFRSVSAVAQCRLWRSKLAKVLASNQLDERQIGIIAMVQCVLTPDLYVGARRASTNSLLEDLEADARAAFSTEQFDSIFMTMGAKTGTTQASSYHHFRRIRARRMVDCHCNTYSDYCGGGSTCRRGCNVDPGGSGTGCGFLWLWICNGTCR
jgi:hypothetical protein